LLSKLLTFKQVQEYLQIGKDSLLYLLHSGQLKGFKIKGRWRVHEDDLRDYLNGLRGQVV
jgi:excisionase family DNA binding protein